jgi:hypothetical protein
LLALLALRVGVGASPSFGLLALRVGVRPPASPLSASSCRLPTASCRLSLQLGDHLRQRLALDEPHDVKVHAALAADAVYVDNVRVLQLGGGQGLVLEAGQLPRVERAGEGQQLERHAPRKREVYRLVDHAHAPAAELAHQAIIAQLAHNLLTAAGRSARHPTRRACRAQEGE